MVITALQYILTLSLFFAEQIICAPTSPTDISTFLNTSWSVDPSRIDSRFSIEAHYYGSALPGLACLLNAVNAMQDLALEDFEEPIVPIPYRLHDFPEVIITPQTTMEGGAIQTRFIIWGLWRAILAMLRTNIFQIAIFTLKWDDATVGYLNISGPRLYFYGGAAATTKDLAQTSNFTDPLDNPEVAVRASTNTTQSTDDQQLTVIFTPGAALTANDVLITILYGLVYASHFRSAQEAEPFDLPLPSPFNTRIGFSGTQTVPQTSSPILNYQWVILTLARIPQYMLHQGRFTAVSFMIKVSGVIVGQGQVSKER